MLSRLKNIWKLGEYKIEQEKEVINGITLSGAPILVRDNEISEAKPKGQARIVEDDPMSLFPEEA